MTNPNVTMRHARQAIHLLLVGAIQDIQTHFGPDQEDQWQDAVGSLFNEVVEEIGNWETPGTYLTRVESMIDDMGAMLGDPDCPLVVRELLAKYDLNP